MQYDSQGNVVQNALITQIQRVLAFSTSTPLAGAGVYTSATLDTTGYKVITYYFTSDQAGSFFIQYSDDGITWYNHATTAVAIAANAISNSFATMQMRYVRAVYTNGATLQGSFKGSGYLYPL